MPRNATLTSHRLVAWLLSAAILGVSAVAIARLATSPHHHMHVKVLGEKATAPDAAGATGGSSVGKGQGNANGNGTPAHNRSTVGHGNVANGGGTSNVGVPISVTGDVLGSVAPGVSAPVRVTLTNPNSLDVAVTSVNATIGTPTNAGCLASWFRVTDYSGSKPVAKNGRATVDLSFAMLNLPVNQDACKSATIPVFFRATASS